MSSGGEGLGRADQPVVSLFGAHRPDGELEPKPLVVDLFAPPAGLGWLALRRTLPACVHGEGVADAAPATAELALRLPAIECRVRFTDDAGAPRQIVLQGRFDSGCLRARTELVGSMEGPEGALGRVRLRLNWRALRR